MQFTQLYSKKSSSTTLPCSPASFNSDELIQVSPPSISGARSKVSCRSVTTAFPQPTAAASNTAIPMLLSAAIRNPNQPPLLSSSAGGIASLSALALTSGTEIRAALRLHDPPNQRPATPARLPFPRVRHEPLDLKDARPVADCLTNRRDDSALKRAQLRRAQSIRSPSRIDPRAPQRFARVNVADAGDQSL